MNVTEYRLNELNFRISERREIDSFMCNGDCTYASSEFSETRCSIVSLEGTNPISTQ